MLIPIEGRLTTPLLPVVPQTRGRSRTLLNEPLSGHALEADASAGRATCHQGITTNGRIISLSSCSTM